MAVDEGRTTEGEYPKYAARILIATGVCLLAAAAQAQGPRLVDGHLDGRHGSLRLAFKYPETFGAVASMEPGIAPIDDWNDMRPKHRFWRADDLMESIYGNPVDREYWNANNPATIAQARADAIRESGLKIFLEAGDEDLFWLYEGTEVDKTLIEGGERP